MISLVETFLQYMSVLEIACVAQYLFFQQGPEFLRHLPLCNENGYQGLYSIEPKR